MDQAVFSYDPIDTISDWMLRSRSGGFEELMDLGCFIDRGGWWNAREGLENRFTRAVDFKNRECEERTTNILMLAMAGYTTREIGDLVGLSAMHVSRILRLDTGRCYKTPQKRTYKSNSEEKNEKHSDKPQLKISQANGYDKHRHFKMERLVEMYVAEGLPRHLAERRAEAIHKEIRRLEMRDKRFWTRVRRFEVHNDPVTQSQV